MRRSQEGSSPQRWSLPGRALRAGLAVVFVAGIAAGCSDETATDLSTTGTLLVTAVTSGLEVDGSYIVFINDEDSYRLSSGDALSLVDIPIGEYLVELRDVAANCTVTSENPKLATIIRSFEITVRFTVSCAGQGTGDKPDRDPGDPAE